MTLRIRHCLDSQLTDGKAVSLMCCCFAPQEHYFSASGTHFCSGLEWPEGLGSLIKTIYLIGSQTCDLLACRIAP
jgi:hypothetical protein